MYSDTGGGGANFVIVKSGKPNDACCTDAITESKRSCDRNTGQGAVLPYQTSY